MTSHSLDETADITKQVAHYRAAHRRNQEPVIDLGEAATELDTAAAEVTEMVSDLETAPWWVAVGALALFAFFAVWLAVELW